MIYRPMWNQRLYTWGLIFHAVTWSVALSWHPGAICVMKLLQNIDTKKAAGPDLFPARILKEAAIELTPILTALFRQFYESGLLPADWKKANVSAIYKKGPKSDPKNYRPVSLTTLTCKIMEHIVCSHLSRHLSANSIITPLQHGFWRGYSVDICHSQMG